MAQLLKQEILALKNSIFAGFTLILCGRHGRHCLRPNYSKLQVTKVKIFSFTTTLLL